MDPSGIDHKTSWIRHKIRAPHLWVRWDAFAKFCDGSDGFCDGSRWDPMRPTTWASDGGRALVVTDDLDPSSGISQAKCASDVTRVEMMVPQFERDPSVAV